MEESRAQEIAAMGGKARAARMTAEERRESARMAAESRHGKSIPRATHAGELIIAGQTIACAVLETRKRVLTQETFLTAIGRAAKAKAGTGSTLMVDGLPPFLSADNLNPFISDELRQSTTPIIFRTIRGNRAFGYEAMLLPMVCEVYLQARDDGKLLHTQLKIAAACALHVAYFNFCWRLRENGKSGKLRPTPCQMAGVTREQWTVGDLFSAVT